MPSLRTFVLQRILLVPVTVFIMITVVFVLLRVLPGSDPVRAINPQIPANVANAITENLGLNKPLLDQYIDFIFRIINMDFGRSFQTSTNVLDLLIPRFAATVELSLVAVSIGIPLGIYVGSYSGRWRETKRDHVLRIYSIAFFALPIFLFGIYMQNIFGIISYRNNKGWIPPNLRATGGVASAIHKVTGIWSIDTLLFSGPQGWENIFYLIGIGLLFSSIIFFIYKKNKEEIEKNNFSDYKYIIVAFLTYSLILWYYIGFKNNLLIGIDIPMGRSLPILDLYYAIPALFRVPIDIFFTLLAIGIWPLCLGFCSKDFQSKVKKGWAIGIPLALIPTIFYFWDAWTVPRYTVNNNLVTGLDLFKDVFSHLLLPGLALGLLVSAVVSRIVRTNMIVAMNDAYIDASRARGISDRHISYNYALKNATVPAVPLIGLQFALLLAGAVLTETVFSYQGLGLFLFDAIQLQDYPNIQGAIIFFSFAVAIVSFFTDLLYAILDPRVRL